MPCRIGTNCRINGLDIVRLENELVALEILPELGAKIYKFIHKPSGASLLWNNPRLPPARVHYGARFDDNWSGGWDELIPNDIPYAFPNGDVIPDHGEVWSQACEWQVRMLSEEAITVAFTTLGRVLPTRFEKEIRLDAGQSFFRLRYAYENQGPVPVNFLWNIHPALSISPASRLELPARRGFVEAWNNDRFEAGLEYEWPYAPDRMGRIVDLRVVPPPSETVADHHYLPDVKEGWYAVTDTEKKTGFGLVFPTAVFPHLWLFRAIGGWRGLNTLIVEVSSGYPNDLRKAIESGDCGVVAPGGAVRAEVVAVAYEGIGAVERIDANGGVIPRISK